MKNTSVAYVMGMLLITGLFMTACQSASNLPADNDGDDMAQTQTQTQTQTTSTSNVGASVNVTDTSGVKVTYKDGEYTETGNYVAPSGPDHLNIKVTLKDNKITNVALATPTTNPTSQHYQGLFVEGLKKEIVGKDISSIPNLSRLNGSSLTAGGFNEALAKIKTDAQK